MKNELHLHSLEKDTLTLLEGKVPEPIEAQSYEFEGNIDAPTEYYKKQFANIDDSTAVFEINTDHKAASVGLIICKNQSVKTVVVGKIQQSDDLDDFRINSDEGFGPDELRKMLKANKFMFEQPSIATEMITKLGSFKLQMEVQMEQANNDRGSIKVGLETLVQEEKLSEYVPKSITVIGRLFKGFKPEPVTLDIEAYPEGNMIKFYFKNYSLKANKQALIDEKIKSIKDDLETFISDNNRAIPVLTVG